MLVFKWSFVNSNLFACGQSLRLYGVRPVLAQTSLPQKTRYCSFLRSTLFLCPFVVLWASSRLFLFVFFFFKNSLRQQGKKNKTIALCLCSPASRYGLRPKNVYLLACGSKVGLVAIAIAGARVRTSHSHPSTLAPLATASRSGYSMLRENIN